MRSALAKAQEDFEEQQGLLARIQHEVLAARISLKPLNPRESTK